jgi:two-component system nitrate/nitrite response regulator NarL
LIARELNIAEGTVKVHIKNLLKKLKFRSRLEAAVWAIDQNLRQQGTGHGARC